MPSFKRTSPFDAECKGQTILANLIEIPVLRLSPTAALMVLQGMELSQLFPDDARFMHSRLDSPELGFGELERGPFVLLEATLTPFSDPSPRLLNVSLAAISWRLEGLTRQDIAGALLTKLLKSRTT